MAIFKRNVPVVTTTPTVDVEGLTAGQHRLQLVVEDEAGNQSEAVIAEVTVIAVTVAIDAVEPLFGQAGDRVSIRGSGFDAQPARNAVTFNGVKAVVSSGSATDLAVTVPAAATTGPLTVSNRRGTATYSLPFVIPRISVVEVGPSPIDLAFDPQRGEIWVVNSGAVERDRGSVAVVSLDAGKVVATIVVGALAQGNCADPAGRAAAGGSD